MRSTRGPIGTPRHRRLAMDAHEVALRLAEERRMVSEAILLVSMGGSPRVTVAGLRHPDQVLESSRRLAATRRVRLVALATDDERTADLAVEALEALAAIERVDPVERVSTRIGIRAAARGGA